MRRAFLEFVSNHVEGEAPDLRVMRSFGFQAERRFITPAELSRRLNIDPRAVARSIPPQESKGKRSKIWRSIDLEHFEWKGTQPGMILNLRAAAKGLGMPAQVLRALRNRGDFRVDNLCAGHGGFHERDLTAFKERLLNCVDQRGLRETGKPGETSSLGHVLKSRRHGTDDKVALLRELLNGNVKAVRGEDDSVLNIHLRMNALQQFWQRRIASTHGSVVTGADAAKQIGCSYEVVKGLIKARKIGGIKSGSSWLIDAETVQAFRLDFEPISLLAEMHCTSSRRIKQVCSHEGIPLLKIPLRERRVKLFSSSTDGERIGALLESKRSVRMILTDEVKSIADDTKPAYRSNGTGGLQGCDGRIG
jgi:excisionase family DNA binding protein